MKRRKYSQSQSGASMEFHQNVPPKRSTNQSARLGHVKTHAVVAESHNLHKGLDSKNKSFQFYLTENDTCNNCYLERSKCTPS